MAARTVTAAMSYAGPAGGNRSAKQQQATTRPASDRWPVVIWRFLRRRNQYLSARRDRRRSLNGWGAATSGAYRAAIASSHETKRFFSSSLRLFAGSPARDDDARAGRAAEEPGMKTMVSKEGPHGIT